MAAKTKLTVRFEADNKKFLQELKQTNKGLRGTQMALARIPGAAMAVKASLAAVAAAGAGAALGIKKSVSAAADFEVLRNQFEGIAGSADLARKRLEFLDDLSLKTPFAPEQLAQVDKLLFSLNNNAFVSAKTLEMISDAAAGSASSAADAQEKLNTVAEKYGRILLGLRQGMAIGEETRRLTELGVLGGEAAESIRKAAVEVGKLKEGGRDVDIAKGMEIGNEGLILLNQGLSKFEGQGRAFSDTLRGMMSNLGIAVTQAFRDVGEPLLDPLNSLIGDLSEVLNEIREQGGFEELGNSLTSIVDSTGHLTRDLATVAQHIETIANLIGLVSAPVETLGFATRAVGEGLGLTEPRERQEQLRRFDLFLNEGQQLDVKKLAKENKALAQAFLDAAGGRSIESADFGSFFANLMVGKAGFAGTNRGTTIHAEQLAEEFFRGFEPTTGQVLEQFPALALPIFGGEEDIAPMRDISAAAILTSGTEPGRISEPNPRFVAQQMGAIEAQIAKVLVEATGTLSDPKALQDAIRAYNAAMADQAKHMADLASATALQKASPSDMRKAAVDTLTYQQRAITDAANMASLDLIKELERAPTLGRMRLVGKTIGQDLIGEMDRVQTSLAQMFDLDMTDFKKAVTSADKAKFLADASLEKNAAKAFLITGAVRDVPQLVLKGMVEGTEGVIQEYMSTLAAAVAKEAAGDLSADAALNVARELGNIAAKMNTELGEQLMRNVVNMPEVAAQMARTGGKVSLTEQATKELVKQLALDAPTAEALMKAATEGIGLEDAIKNLDNKARKGLVDRMSTKLGLTSEALLSGMDASYNQLMRELSVDVSGATVSREAAKRAAKSVMLKTFMSGGLDVLTGAPLAHDLDRLSGMLVEGMMETLELEHRKVGPTHPKVRRIPTIDPKLFARSRLDMGIDEFESIPLSIMQNNEEVAAYQNTVTQQISKNREKASRLSRKAINDGTRAIKDAQRVGTAGQVSVVQDLIKASEESRKRAAENDKKAKASQKKVNKTAKSVLEEQAEVQIPVPGTLTELLRSIGIRDEKLLNDLRDQERIIHKIPAGDVDIPSLDLPGIEPLEFRMVEDPLSVFKKEKRVFTESLVRMMNEKDMRIPTSVLQDAIQGFTVAPIKEFYEQLTKQSKGLTVPSEEIVQYLDMWEKALTPGDEMRQFRDMTFAQEDKATRAFGPGTSTARGRYLQMLIRIQENKIRDEERLIERIGSTRGKETLNRLQDVLESLTERFKEEVRAEEGNWLQTLQKKQMLQKKQREVDDPMPFWPLPPNGIEPGLFETRAEMIARAKRENEERAARVEELKARRKSERAANVETVIPPPVAPKPAIPGEGMSAVQEEALKERGEALYRALIDAMRDIETVDFDDMIPGGDPFPTVVENENRAQDIQDAVLTDKQAQQALNDVVEILDSRLPAANQ